MSKQARANFTLQKKAIRAFCAENGHDLAGIYEDSAPWSVLETSGRKRLLQTLEGVDGLIVYRLEYFARTALEAEETKRIFKQEEKQLFTVARQIDLSTEGAFAFAVNSAVSELERKRLLQRCRSAQARKLQEGGYAGGRPPYGYAAERGHLVEMPQEQQVITFIKSMRRKGSPSSKIADVLNFMGVPTKTGRRWAPYGVMRIINGKNQRVLVQRLHGTGELPRRELDA